MSEKEFKKFDKTISNILSSSSGAASWSDLLSFLKELFTSLEKRKGDLNYTFLSDKTTLSKRLAQCLNPENPAGVHESALKIYIIIFENIISKNNGKLEDNLGIYSSGLFPFFSYASFQNKIFFLEKIVSTIFLNLDQNELNVCFPGLLSSLIPCLDDNNETITSKIYFFFDEVQKKLKKGVFYGTYWSLLLKNKSLRPSGIKYLYEKNIKYVDYEVLDEENKKTILENEFPDINVLVVNSLSQLIEDKDIPTVRVAMDFVISRLPLTKNNTMLSDNAKISLIISALKLLIKNEYSTTRRLINWITGSSNIDDDIDLESPDIKYRMDLVIKAFKIMLNSHKLINSENLKNYVQILNQLFDQQIAFADIIFPNIAYDLILCFVNFWIFELNSSENVLGNETIKNLNKFFDKDNNYVECLWKSIGNYLDSIQDRNDIEFDKTDYNSLKNVEIFINQLIPPLKFSYLFIDLQNNEDVVKYYIPIINNLLKIMNKLVFKNRDGIQKFRYILFTTLVFTKSLQEKKLQNNLFTNNKTPDNINTNATNLNRLKKKSSLFTELNQESISNEVEENIELYNISEESSLKTILSKKYLENIIASFTETIVEYQKCYIRLLNEFLLFKKDSQITKNEINIFKNSTELMIRLQEYSQNEELPEWLQYIEKIIFNEDINTKLSLEAANCLLDLNLSSFNGHEIYQKIKSAFSEKELDSSIIKSEYLEKIIKKTGVKNNCQELLMGQLYIFSDQGNQKKIIDLLVKLSNLDLQKFINILENTFKLEDTLENSLKLFSEFWQLLNEYYDNIKLFKKGECLFQMLDYLDCDKPLLRHLSKSWLDQSSKQFRKIVDPILLILLDPNIKINKSERFFYIEKEYDIKKIMDSFRKLKSLILNSPIMKFFIENKASDEIIISFNQNKSFSLIDQSEDNYLYILIAISLKFTQGKSKEELSETFKSENAYINASSCEFLEFLLSHINSEEIIMSFAIKLNLPILELIDEAIDSKNEVMQVQLLSVLKVLYFKTIPIHLKYKNDAFLLFSNQSLINCLTKGMTSNNYFLRENFINFTRECLPCFRSVMDDNNGKKAYYKFGQNFITALTLYLSTRITIDTKGRKDTERFSHFDELNNVNYFIYKNYLDEYKEYKLYDEGDSLLILKGIKDVTYHFLNIKPNQKNSKDFWPNFKNNLIEAQKTPSGFLFGLFSGEDEKKNEDQDVKGLFSSQIMNLLQCFLLTWTNKSDKYEPYDFCLNVNGILPLKQINKEIFTEQDIKEGLEAIKSDPLKKIVIEISSDLFITSPIEFMETLLTIWNFNPKNKPMNIDISKDAQYKITIIEFLISLDIPLNIILYCLNIIVQKNIKIEKENERKKKKMKYEKETKLKVFITPYKVGKFEAKLFHFIYSYILLNPFYQIPLIIYGKDQMRNEICESWREMISLLNTIITDTKIIYTYCWMYELLQITLVKYKLDKVFDVNTKNKLIELFNTITEKLNYCVFNDKTDSIYIKEGKLILPYLPHIYINIVKEVYPEFTSYLYNKYYNSSQNINEEKFTTIKDGDSLKNTDSQKLGVSSSGINSKLEDFYSLYYSATKLSNERVDLNATPNSNKDFLNQYYRYISCITLKENFSTILISLYGDLNLCKKNITDIIRQLINFLKLNSQDFKDDSKMFFAEFASDFLASLMKDCPAQVTLCGKSMYMDYLNDPSFFITTPKILRNWRKFISLSVKYYPEIISELIKNINTGFLFLGGSDEDKIKTLRRISFVIYSCEGDTFGKDFELIKEKAKIFLSGYKNNIRLEGEIFLMMRILFLRFSHDSVMKMIKDLWPIIFSELIENFKNESRNNNIKLLIESFKFIELLSLANKEEFSLYQWIFLLDTFNMKDLDTRNPESLLSTLLKRESKVFRPMAVDILSKGNTEVSDEIIKGNQVGKSQLVFQPKGETLEQLQNDVKKFFYSIGDMNNYKVELDSDQIEKFIEKDFLDDGAIKN